MKSSDKANDNPNDDVKPVDAPEAPAPIQEDQPPGCLPGLIAATLLMGILGFLLCGVTTWILFQKRTEFAIRTLKGQVEVIEQSLLEPEDKKGVITELNALIEVMSVPDYPPAQAAEVMQRLVRLPMAQWGELAVIESFMENDWSGDERTEGLKQLSRMRRSVEVGRATVIDINDALQPVTTDDLQSSLGRTLNQPLQKAAVAEVVLRAKLVADRGEVADRTYPQKSMTQIVKEAIAN